MVICFVLTSTSAAAAGTRSMAIGGHLYALELTPNHELTSKIRFRQERLLRGQHYRGTLKNIPGSWVRASHIDGTWQGVVSIGGEIYVLDSADGPAAAPNNAGAAAARISQLSATPVANFEPQACGVDHATPLVTARAEVEEPASALRIAREVQFSSLCASTINGTCLIAELEVAFAADYVARFSDAVAAAEQAVALLNTAEGFYRNDFNISFEALSLELMDNDVSNETDATDLLNIVNDARDNGTFGIVQNPRSFFHFVTGRDLEGGTAGIAFLDEICTTNAVGLTSLILNPVTNAPNINLTALVMAHELGHNFGANHDETENACSSGFIMESTVDPFSSAFSSCSIDEITTAIEAVTNPALCFNFPADAGISAAAGNPTEVANSEEFTASYTLTSAATFQAIPTLLVNGSVAATQGRFTSVTLSGQNCALGAQGLSYSCSLSAPPSASTLLVNAIATGAALELTHTTGLAGSNDIRDVDASNDEQISAFSVVGGAAPNAPSDLSVQQGNGTAVTLSWQDNSNNESSFIIERRLAGETFAQLAAVSVNTTSFTDTTTSANNRYEYRVAASNSSGFSATTAIAQITVTTAFIASVPSGGSSGGSSHWSMLLLLAALTWRRRVTRPGLAT